MQTKSLMSMAVPLMISFTARFLFIMVDTAYAAVLGDDNAAVAAIGLYAPFQQIYIAIWVGISAGFTAALSRAFGARDERRIGELTRGMSRIFTVLIPVMVLGGVGVWFGIPHAGLEPALSDAFRTYAATLMIGMPLTGFWSIYPDSIIKAHHDTRSTMVAGLLSSASNVTLNTIFVFVFGWGLFGIAIGTVLSRIPAFLFAMHRMRVLERRRLARDGQATRGAGPRTGARTGVRAILVLAIPGALTYVLTAIEAGTVNGLLTGLADSVTALAAFNVYNQLLALTLMPAVATSVAVVPFAARLLPQGRSAEVLANLRRTLLILAALCGTLAIAAGWLLADPLAAFFVKEKTAGDATSPLTLTALRLLPLATLASIPFLVLRPMFEAAARPRQGVRVSVARFVVFALPLIIGGRYLAPALGFSGLLGIILGLVAASLLASALVWVWVPRQGGATTATPA